MKQIKNILEELNNNNISFKENEILSKYTTWKIGGPARIFVEINKIEDIIIIKNIIKKYDIPYFYLGGGSNILISDNGFNGIIIKNNISKIEVLNTNKEIINSKNNDKGKLEPRLVQIDKEKYYSFDDLNYDESKEERVEVKIYSGTNLSYAINSLINNGITGLQWFAGIPGSIGGAIYNNIHGGTYFISNFLKEVEVINKEGNLEVLDRNDLKMDYDYSIIQLKKLFILSGTFILYKGDKIKAQNTAIKWAQSKRIMQPYNSAGCCFKNISLEEKNKLKLLSNSWGYIIEHKLGLKGYKYNDAQISNKHSAFIENLGNAKSEDIMYLLNLIYKESKEKLNITPKTEIFFLGFSEEEIKQFK